MTFDRQSPPGRVPAVTPRVHCHGRAGRLDPLRLSRAVERLQGAGSSLAQFAHLDLTTVGTGERRRAAEEVAWMLGRCLESGRGSSSLLVAYLDPGEQQAGHLLVAGSHPAVADAASCVALSEELLELYRTLGPE